MGLLKAALVTGAAALRNLALSMSLALSYLASPADGAGLLDALLDCRFQLAAQRVPAHIRGRLAAVGAAVAALLCETGQGAAKCMNHGQIAYAEGAAGSPGSSHTTRLRIALTTYAINAPPGGPEAIQMRCYCSRIADGIQFRHPCREERAQVPLRCMPAEDRRPEVCQTSSG